jgi:hypothetical protein
MLCARFQRSKVEITTSPTTASGQSRWRRGMMQQKEHLSPSFGANTPNHSLTRLRASRTPRRQLHVSPMTFQITIPRCHNGKSTSWQSRLVCSLNQNYSMFDPQSSHHAIATWRFEVLICRSRGTCPRYIYLLVIRDFKRSLHTI